MQNTFWNQLESKQISKEQVETFLISKLGTPSNPIQTNLLSEIIKKVNAYYFAQEITNTTIFSLIGKVEKVSDIIQKQYKEGKRKGLIYYVINITTDQGTKEKLQASAEFTLSENLQQIHQSAILGQNLVFRYRVWITNKELLEFYPYQKTKPKKGK